MQVFSIGELAGHPTVYNPRHDSPTHEDLCTKLMYISSINMFKGLLVVPVMKCLLRFDDETTLMSF
jgi:hypothetical protein